ncbi:hypothetical protein QSJ18_09490 [Gordonia sp. ABSL1-1]|uniref:hypothetical protein n=1 Tax=Gordonia sp. ABSL1-1 TaxID=3053923 RepID=UPI002572FA4E|nr:hypothetical protein [Gordonia sp. ABSL1-1]MDL9936972.1 hypothetical protein [Gordonia sp. ABSL1-1]
MSLPTYGEATAAPVPQGTAPGPACAWQLMSNSTDLNVAFPDVNATYWILPYALGGGDSIQLSGRYPQARYFSLNTYGTDFNTVDTLRDSQIQPDPGSNNPYSTTAGAGSGDTWHATVVPGAADHSRNQMRGVRAGQSTPIGFLIIRVYVPDDPRSLSGGVQLPTVTVKLGGSSTVLRPCATPFNPRDYSGPVSAALTAVFDRVIGQAASGSFPSNAPEAKFINPASTSGLFPNGDNKYIGAGMTYRKGRVLVIRGKAPTFPNTRVGQSPTTPGPAMRYWSMCQNDKVTPYPVVACAADFQTRLDSSGYYTYVVAATADMSRSPDPTITIINWGDTSIPTKVVFIRNMLPSNDFYPYSVQASQARHTDPAVTMGEYYPRAAYCDVTVLRTRGWRACYPN